MEWQYNAATAAEALEAREAFVNYLRNACTADSDFKAAELVFGELVANVVRHAPGPIQLSVDIDVFGSVTLEVCDTGPAFTLSPSLPSEVFSASGRGLYVVSRLCRQMTAIRTTVGNRVRVVLPVVASRSSGRTAARSQ